MILRFEHKPSARFEAGINVETPARSIVEISDLHPKPSGEHLTFIGFNRCAVGSKFILADGNNDIIVDIKIFLKPFFRELSLQVNPPTIVEFNPTTECDVTSFQLILLSYDIVYLRSHLNFADSKFARPRRILRLAMESTAARPPDISNFWVEVITGVGVSS